MQSHNKKHLKLTNIPSHSGPIRQHLSPVLIFPVDSYHVVAQLSHGQVHLVPLFLLALQVAVSVSLFSLPPQVDHWLISVVQFQEPFVLSAQPSLHRFALDPVTDSKEYVTQYHC